MGDKRADPGPASGTGPAFPPLPYATQPRSRTEVRTPALACAPLGLDLLLGWPLLAARVDSSGALRLAAGLLVLLLIHESTMRLLRGPAAARPVWLCFAVLALAAGLALAPAFGALLLLVKACVLLAARAPGPTAAALAQALAATLRIEAGALLADLPGSPWVAALAGLLALSWSSARDLRRRGSKGRREHASARALSCLAATSLANGCWLAILTRSDLLAAGAPPWARLSVLMLLAASWALCARRPARAPPGRETPLGLDPVSLAFALAWLVLVILGAPSLAL